MWLKIGPVLATVTKTNNPRVQELVLNLVVGFPRALQVRHVATKTSRLYRFGKNEIFNDHNGLRNNSLYRAIYKICTWVSPTSPPCEALE